MLVQLNLYGWFGWVKICLSLQKLDSYICVALPSIIGIARAKQTLFWTQPQLSTTIAMRSMEYPHALIDMAVMVG